MANRGIVRLQSRPPERVETGNALNVALQDIKLNMSCVMLLNYGRGRVKTWPGVSTAIKWKWKSFTMGNKGILFCL